MNRFHLPESASSTERSYGSLQELESYRMKLFRIDAMVSTIPPVLALTYFGFPVERNPLVICTAAALLILAISSLSLASTRTFEWAKAIRVGGVLGGVLFAEVTYPFYQHEFLFLPVIVFSLFLAYPFKKKQYTYISGGILVLTTFILAIIENHAIADPNYNLFNKVHLLAVTYSFLVSVIFTWLVLRKSNSLIQKNQDLIRTKNKELEKYIESNLQLEQFAHVASHDLRSPLRTISSFSSLLEKRSGDKLNDEEIEYLNFIQSGVRNLGTLIDDLLSYSKVDTLDIQLLDIDVQALLDRVLHSLAYPIQEADAQISTHCEVKNIQGDATKLQQLLQNLVSNAIKFSERSRTQVQIRVEEREHQALFSIRDNGIGIDEQFQKLVFEPCIQLNGKDEYEGSGLGLSICKKIINQHGGEIWVESNVDHGSTFYFTLPLNAMAPLGA